MAHFIGEVRGQRGEASRLGTRKSGIEATARGWEIGGKVVCQYDASNDMDRVYLAVNGGSSGGRGSREVARASYSHATGKVYVEVCVNGEWREAVSS